MSNLSLQDGTWTITPADGNIVGVDIVRQYVPNSNQGGNTIAYEGYTPEACTLSEITVFMKTLNTQGTYTATFTNVTTGNTVLSTANFNMQTLSANTWTTLTLTGTASDLSFAADDRFRISFASNNASFDGSGIYFAMRFTASSSFTPRAMELLFSTTLTGTQTTISTGTLPTGYRNLVIKGQARCDDSLVARSILVAFNGDTTDGNYSYVRDFSTQSQTNFQTNNSGEERIIGVATGATAAANTFGVFTLTIYNHESTNNIKSYISVAGFVDTSSRQTNRITGKRLSVDAITSVAFSVFAGDFVAGSSIAVYGIR